MLRRDLTAAESDLWDAAEDGRTLELGERPVDERTIRAEALRAILTGGGEAPRPRRVAVTGAGVVGVLDLTDSTLACSLALTGCAFGEPVLLRQARGEAISFAGSQLPALDCELVDVRGNLSVRGTMLAWLDLRGARVNGRLDAVGLAVTGLDGESVVAEGLSVAHDADFSNLAARGKLRFGGATVNGRLYLSGAQVEGAAGVAADFAQVTIERGIVGQEMRLRGDVDVSSARVSGILSLDGS